MKELPIIFNSEMVNDTMLGRRKNTRIPVKNVPSWANEFGYSAFTPKGYISARGNHPVDGPCEKFIKLPCEKGDWLYIKETTVEDRSTSDTVILSKYQADGSSVLYQGENCEYAGSIIHWDYPRKSRPSIHMPKDAARIWLRVTGVRVEQVWDENPWIWVVSYEVISTTGKEAINAE